MHNMYFKINSFTNYNLLYLTLTPIYPLSRLHAQKKAEEEAALRAATEAANSKPSTPQPKPKLDPIPVKPPAQLPPKLPPPKPQLTIPPPIKLPNSIPPAPVKITTELTKPRPKPSVVIEQRHPDLGGVEGKETPGGPGMSHLDAILARNGLGHYIGNDFSGGSKSRSESEYLEQYRYGERGEGTRSEPGKVGEGVPSRPSSTNSTISHRTILQQQQKQVGSPLNFIYILCNCTAYMQHFIPSVNSYYHAFVNSCSLQLLIQQQTQAQQNKDPSSSVRNEQALRNEAISRNEQALLNEHMLQVLRWSF